MQSVIVHGGTVEEALESPEAVSLVPPGRVEEVLRPSATLPAAERIGVYHAMYLLRMAEALESDYPALAHYLGDERWRDVVRNYVSAHPSRSYTLNRLGRDLADWLRQAAGLPRRGFCHDLARLEWAVTESFDAVEAPRLREGDLARVLPEEWSGARLVPSPALRLLSLRWNANAWLDSARDEHHDHPKPRRADSWVAVFRHRYAVYRRLLTRPAFGLLSDLAAGRRVGEALSRASRRAGAPDDETLARWFRDWSADGFFTRIEVA
jgi:hypothetical protein